MFEGSDLQTLEDLIKFNAEHADEELPSGMDSKPLAVDNVNLTSMQDHPSQGQFEKYAESDMSRDEYDTIFRAVREQSLSSIESALSEHQIDVIMAPGDSRLVSVASGAGCPLANLPLGFADFNGRAHGLTVVARPRHEIDLLRVMSAWEGSFPEALAPPPMMSKA